MPEGLPASPRVSHSNGRGMREGSEPRGVGGRRAGRREPGCNHVDSGPGKEYRVPVEAGTGLLAKSQPMVGISLGILIGLVSGFPLGHLFRTLRAATPGGFGLVMTDIGLLVAFWVGGWFGDTAILKAIDASTIAEPYLVALTATAGPIVLLLMGVYVYWCVRVTPGGVA
jgi:hypothetical protein